MSVLVQSTFFACDLKSNCIYLYHCIPLGLFSLPWLRENVIDSTITKRLMKLALLPINRVVLCTRSGSKSDSCVCLYSQSDQWGYVSLLSADCFTDNLLSVELPVSSRSCTKKQQFCLWNLLERPVPCFVFPIQCWFLWMVEQRPLDYTLLEGSTIAFADSNQLTELTTCRPGHESFWRGLFLDVWLELGVLAGCC